MSATTGKATDLTGGPPRLAPLRRIVRHFTDPRTGSAREEFECGHVRNVKQDIYGPTNAARRRCSTCLKHMVAEYYASFRLVPSGNSRTTR